VHSDAIRSDVLEVGTAEKLLNIRTLITVFECFGRSNCRENTEIKDTKRYILTLFETMFWKLELRRNL